MKKLIFLLISILLISPFTSIFSQKSNTLTSKEKKDGWVLLFDGTSLNGWTNTRGQPPVGGWEVSKGSINTVLGGKGGDIITVEEYKDFDLSVDFLLTPGCNSGVKYFFTTYENGGNLGCEYQVLDDILGEDNKQANHLCGSFYDVLPPIESKKKANPPGSWNTMRVVAKGKSVEHWLNGVKILEYTRGDKVYLDGVAGSKFSKTVPTFGMVEKGHILLQYHGGLVSFKNIKIKII